MLAKVALCQKSLGPVTRITGFCRVICEGYHSWVCNSALLKRLCRLYVGEDAASVCIRTQRAVSSTSRRCIADFANGCACEFTGMSAAAIARDLGNDARIFVDVGEWASVKRSAAPQGPLLNRRGFSPR